MELFETFTTQDLYEVMIVHPVSRLLPVVLRPASEVTTPEIGRLYTDDTLICTIDVHENGDVWACVVQFDKKPEYQYGFFCLRQVRNNGTVKSFGTYKKVEDTIPEDPTQGLPRHYVLEDWASPYRQAHGRNTQKATAAVQPMSTTENNYPQTDMAKLAKRWQDFCRELLCMAKWSKNYIQLSKADKNYIDSKMKDLYSSIKFITNGHGLETNDPRYESLLLEGNYVCEVARTIATAKDYRGKVMVCIYSFDVNDPTPIVTKETLKDPRVQYAKIINPPKPGAPLGYLTNFPHLGTDAQGNVIPVPVPILTNGRRWYPLEELRAE